MKISILSDKSEFSLGHSPGNIKDLLSELKIQQVKGLAISVNGNIISPFNYASVVLSDSDEVEIIKATQGG